MTPAKAAWIVVAGLLAVGTAARAAEPGTTEAAGFDPDQAWIDFLKGDDARLAPAFAAYHAIEYAQGRPVASTCSAQRDALAAAVEAVPVSIALRRVDMLCAEVLGDEAGAERAMAALSELVSHALRSSSDPYLSRPIRLVRAEDAGALLDTLGLRIAYVYVEDVHPRRYLPVMVGASAADGASERLFAFDYMDTAATLEREHPDRAFPVYRNRLAHATYQAQARNGAEEGRDAKAVAEAWSAPTAEGKIAAMREGAAQGGLLSIRSWLAWCIALPSPGCGDGVVDALLPLAEARKAVAMALLALAYDRGIGIDADPAAAAALLDAANRRLPANGGTVVMARAWRDGGNALPGSIRTALAAAADAGNPMAVVLLLDDAADDPALLARAESLVDARANNAGRMESAIAGYHSRGGRPAEAMAWWLRAAAKGEPAAAEVVGSARYFGRDGLAVDRDAARPLLREAAMAARPYATRLLAYEAVRDGRAADAERWLLPAIWAGEQDAHVAYAEIVIDAADGTLGDSHADAIAALRHYAGRGHAEARSVLAQALLSGTGTAKDVPAARALLEAGALAGDHDAAVALATSYLHPGPDGEPGGEPADEPRAMRWLQPALDAGSADAHALLGDWLYFRSAAPDARARAFEHWARAAEQGHRLATNNAAWHRCVTPADRDPRAGMALARQLAAMPDLPAGLLDTVAACHAAVGEFDEAVRIQDRAIAEASGGDLEFVERFRDRRALYASGRSYSEDAPTRPGAEP